LKSLSCSSDQVQRRQLNAWSPAQRYFVEGDHVINAEINRTFQFTGLDSGMIHPLGAQLLTSFFHVLEVVFCFLP
jgi:NADH-ubiquinone oxidoreductase chain 3